MATFLVWLNGPPDTNQVIRAALAHLWFVTIHPFDDGNGRIARVISDMCLARSGGTRQRFYSMSSQIHTERAQYYRLLEDSQRADNSDITPWMSWFPGCLARALQSANVSLDVILSKARFWQTVADVPIYIAPRMGWSSNPGWCLQPAGWWKAKTTPRGLVELDKCRPHKVMTSSHCYPARPSSSLPTNTLPS